MVEAGDYEIDDTQHKSMKIVQVNMHNYQEWQ